MTSKRDLILQAALKQFAEVGYDRATMQSIAKHAGVGKGTTYEYFESKEALFTEVISNRLNEILQVFKDELEIPGTVHEKITRMYEKYASLFHSEVELKKILSNDLGHIPKQYHEFFKKKHVEMIDFIENILKEGMKSGEIAPIETRIGATMIIANLNTIATQAELGSMEETIPFILDILFNGLAEKQC